MSNNGGFDLIGEKFGKLTVISKTEKPENKKTPGTYWKCVCECGNETIASGTLLRKGSRKSCGHCLSQSQLEIGQRFGLLTLIVVDHRNKHGTYWLCKCECGNEKIISSHSLKYGGTQSCGCLQKQAAKETGRKNGVDLTGQRFGKLTVIEIYLTSRPTSQGLFWKCICDCGNETVSSAGNLKAGHVKSCGCLNFIDITGERFGRLVAIEIAERKITSNGTRIFWLCKCDCGNEKVVLGDSLRGGSTKSCGCLHLETNRKNGEKYANKVRGTGNYVFNSIYNGYKNSASHRKIEFLLSKEQFSNFISGECHYCGAIFSNSRKDPVTGESFFYNGIDRVDSSKDYTVDNCVSCCKICNNAKMTMSEKEFLEWNERLFYHQHKELIPLNIKTENF
jgi:5-methylcytosine-specific restriction endonuclease McrA